MKKKQIRKNPAAENKPADPKVLKNLKIALGTIITVFVFVLYAQCFKHNYTLDDHFVIDENRITTKGISGIPTILKTDYWYGSGKDELRGPIYRPTSVVIFAIAWQVAPDNPHFYHFITVFFYAVSCLILFLVLCNLFQKQNLVFPFVCALLYAAHPIHTEVVNNIKSLDDVLCFLFGIVSIGYLWKYIATKSKLSFVWGGIGFFLSLISKETGIAFLVIIPMTFYFFMDKDKKPLITVSILLVCLTGLWLLLRAIVFKELPANNEISTSVLNNTLNAAPDFISKYATVFYILLRYIVLLIFPHPLTCDYNYSQIKIQTLNDPAALIGILLYVGIGIYSLINFKRRGVIVFGILFYLITLAPVSNIFFLGGATLAERFMYIPSLGFCFILTYLLIKFTKTESLKWQFDNLTKFFSVNSRLFFIVFGIVFLYSVKIFSRNKDWKDNITIFSHDIQISKNSATAHYILGQSLAASVMNSPNKRNQADTFNLAKKYLKRAIDISHDYRWATSYLGYIYLYENKPDSAYVFLKEGLKMAPEDADLNYYYGTAALKLRKSDEAINALNHAITLRPKHEDSYIKLAASYLSKGEDENGLSCYSKVIEINPNNAAAYYYSGMILKAKGDTIRANEFINKAISLGFNAK